MNDVEFLSNKITKTRYGYAPYYSNLEKMWASLEYTTGDTDEYFQKVCSFINLLVFAPKGSQEHEWCNKLIAHARFLMTTGQLSREYIKCYKTKHMLKRDRLG